MGGRALDRLATAIENPAQFQPVSETVPAELIIRASCGAPARPAGNPRSAPVQRV
jgi:DNA-binding LacI/PurR family transcriptional regulator